MMRIILSALILVPTLSAGAAENPSACSATSSSAQVHPSANLMDLFSSSGDLNKQLQVEFAQNDMAEFCRRNLILRFLNSQNNAPPGCEFLPMNELENLVDRTLARLPEYQNPWILSLISTRKTRLRSVEVKTEVNPAEFSFEQKQDDKDEISQTPRKLDLVFNKYGKVVKTSSAKQAAACASEGPLSYLACSKALEFLAEIATPRAPYNMMTPKAWQQVYGSDRYNEGLRRAALKVQGHFKKSTFSETSNLFEDMVSSFVESGLSPGEATDAAWNSLAVISNAGSNLDTRTQSVERSQKSDALVYLARATVALDYLKQEKGFPLYSYPATVETRCDSAKPYHFWMAAYLARELVKEGVVNADDATRFTFLTEIGYQLNREIGSGAAQKGSSFSVLARKPYDPAHQTVRMDLAYAAGGAFFGAQSAQRTYPGKVKIDPAIVSLLQNSTPVAPQTASNLGMLSELGAMSKWYEVFSPKSAIHTVLNKR